MAFLWGPEIAIRCKSRPQLERLIHLRCCRSLVFLAQCLPTHRFLPAKNATPSQATTTSAQGTIGRDYEGELMPLGLDQHVAAPVWSPLGWGRLTGKLRRSQPLPKVSRLHETAASAPQVEDEHL